MRWSLCAKQGCKFAAENTWPFGRKRKTWLEVHTTEADAKLGDGNDERNVK
jgi:hypothetical protein